MYKHALIPLDGSPLAEKALDPAQGILQPQGKITLLTVLPALASLLIPPLAAEGRAAEDPSIGEPDTVNPKTYLDQIAARLSQSGYEVEVQLAEGDPAEVIVSLAAQRQMDVIVICTHGYSGLKHLLFGSVTSRVLHTTPCPVLVIPGWELQAVPIGDALAVNPSPAA